MKKIPLTKNIRLALIALLFIFTPNVNMVDILPDFIGYFILLRTFMPLSDRIPYFDAVTAFVKRLMYLSLLRIPAFILMGMIKGENYTGNDQTALFTLIFAAAEATLTVYLIINLYQAFSYLCERGGYRADGNAAISLRTATVIMLSLKCFLNFFPTVFLLTRSVEGGYVSYMAKPYPYALVSCIVVALVLSVILYRKWRKFLCEIDCDGLKRAILTLCEATADDANSKIALKGLKAPLSLLAVSSLLAFEIEFDNFHDVNILPKFFYAIPIIIALIKMSERCTGVHKHTKALVLTAGIIFSVLAFATFLTSILFFEQYTIRDLLSSEEARAAFIPIIISSALELAALVPLLLIGARINSVFVREHTGILPSCERYTSADRDYHKALITRGYLVFGLGLLSGAMRFINTVLRFNARLLFTDITDITRPTIVTSAIPWFHIAVFAVTAIYAVVSFSYFSTLKEEINVKYEKEGMH